MKTLHDLRALYGDVLDSNHEDLLCRVDIPALDLHRHD